MKATQIFGAALLGLGLSFSAHAQTPIVGAPGTMSTPGSPATPANTGTIVPGQPGAVVPGAAGTGVGSVIGSGTVQPNATTPIGTSGTTMYPNGVPTRNVDGGTLRSDQQMGNAPTSGSQQTRSLNRNRTRTTNGTTTRP